MTYSTILLLTLSASLFAVSVIAWIVAHNP